MTKTLMSLLLGPFEAECQVLARCLAGSTLTVVPHLRDQQGRLLDDKVKDTVHWHLQHGSQSFQVGSEDL
jgi:hypothetical protein